MGPNGNRVAHSGKSPQLTMTGLQDLLRDCEDDLVASWEAAYEPGTPTPTGQRIGGWFRAWLRSLGPTLKHAPGDPSATPSILGPPSANADGEAVAIAVDALAGARACAVFHREIMRLAGLRNIELTATEHSALVAWTSSAVAQFISRERERQDEAAHHVAHELRNPLGSALMALTLLRPRIAVADDARLADTLERNLKRLAFTIDEQVVRDLGGNSDK